MALLPGSPAIDAGNNALIPAGITTDQRGYPRIVNGSVDIGAYEAQSIPLVVNTTADGAGCPLGKLDLRGAVDLADILPGAQSITFDPSVFPNAQTIMLTSGQLELSNTTGAQTITGPAAGVTVSGGGTSRVLQVDSGVTASVSGLNISGGSTTGNGGGLYNAGGTTTLTGVTLSGNDAAIGGGLFNSMRGTITVIGCTISGNSAPMGGGVYNDGGTNNLTDCTVSGNTAPAIGGGLFNTMRGTITVIGCTIAGNSATAGGGLYNDSATANLDACTFSGNSASVGGGIDNVETDGATLEDTIVASNTGTGGAPSDIGGAGAAGVVGTYDLVGSGGSGGVAGGTGVIVLTNLSNLGLAPLSNYGGPTPTVPLLPNSVAIGMGTAIPGVMTDQRGYDRMVKNTVDIGAFEAQPIPLLVNTTADGTDCPLGKLDLRGAVDLANLMSGSQTITFDPTVFASAQTITLTQGQLELSNTGGTETITSPAAGLTVSGGGLSRVFQVDSGVTASLSGLTISGGSTTANGGGFYNSGTATLSNCTVSGNSAAAGGGMATNGTTNLTNCTVSDNSASDGGGLAIVGGTTNLTDCTVSGNSASHGGGLAIVGGTTTLTDCTVSGNSAVNGSGGGLYNDGGTTTLYDCTVSGNSASDSGGGLANLGVTTTLANTIVAENMTTTSGPDASGTFASQGYNLVGQTDGSSGWVGSDLTGTTAQPLNPEVAPLGDYGGPTQTMPLLYGSPAIGAGNTNLVPSGITTDQRGEPRFFNGKVDIGAYELQVVIVPSFVVDTTADFSDPTNGKTSLREAVASANALPGHTITFDPTVFASAQTITLTGLDLELSDTTGTETITGSAAGVTVSGGGLSRVFQVDAGVTAQFSGLTIERGNTAGNGGGLYNDGTTTLSNCTVSGNSAKGDGGGLGNSGATTLTNCTVSGNSADLGGGLASLGGTTTLTDCTVGGNSAGNSGGFYNDGAATLQNTIVAGNTGSGGSASDIGGDVSSASSYNLIGTGGSGGLDNGTNHNIVLTSLAGLGLAPLGDYGGPTETMALLPASAAIAAGTAQTGITTDQRGASRPASGAADIGSFQDQGYTVAVSSGSPQSTAVSQPFNASLVALLTENLANAPVAGATIGFSAPSSGPSATLSAGSAVTDASGLASVTATANATIGTYVVTASATGVTPPASFSLTNELQPSFSGLIAQTVAYGSTVTLSGTLAADSQVPVGEDVAVTVDGVTNDARIASNGSFSTQFTGADVVLNVSATAYTVTYDYATDGTFLAASGASQLTITPAPLTITASSDSKVYDGTTASSHTPTYGTLYNGNAVIGLTQAFTSKNVLGPSRSTLTVTGYTINDGDGGKDYTVTIQTATGTITPAPLTVRASNVSTVYGSKVPALTYTITGFVSGDNSSVVSGAPVLTTTAASGADAGAYPIAIAVGTLSATNYNFPAPDLIAATLTVTPAPLVINAASTSMFTGQPVPALRTVYTGFVNGDTPASLTKPPVIRTAASPSSRPGKYPIIVSGASSPNYTITYVPGALTVILPPAIVRSVAVEKVSLGKGKTVEGIVLQFSEALTLATAQSVNSYTLATVPNNKKQKSKLVQLSAATYSSKAFTVTLLTRKPLVLNPPLELTVKAASLRDAFGRELDGDDSGKSGANFTAVLSKTGTRVTSAKALTRIGGLSPDAIDAVLRAGLRGTPITGVPGLLTSQPHGSDGHGRMVFTAIRPTSAPSITTGTPCAGLKSTLQRYVPAAGSV